MTADLCGELARAWGAQRAWIVALPARAALDTAVQVSTQACHAAPLDGTPIGCVDIRALGRQARERHVPFIVDCTVPGVKGCAAVRLGAHVAYAKLAPELCVLAVSRDADRMLEGIADRISGLPQVEGERLEEAQRTLENAAREWRQTSDVAQVVASYLACHPRVATVRYPGLKTDPTFAVAARTLQRGFGPVVDVRLVGEQRWHRCGCVAEDPRESVLRLERWLSPEHANSLAL